MCQVVDYGEALLGVRLNPLGLQEPTDVLKPEST